MSQITDTYLVVKIKEIISFSTQNVACLSLIMVRKIKVSNLPPTFYCLLEGKKKFNLRFPINNKVGV